jgi:hypothetical protein
MTKVTTQQRRPDRVAPITQPAVVLKVQHLPGCTCTDCVVLARNVASGVNQSDLIAQKLAAARAKMAQPTGVVTHTATQPASNPTQRIPTTPIVERIADQANSATHNPANRGETSPLNPAATNRNPRLIATLATSMTASQSPSITAPTERPLRVTPASAMRTEAEGQATISSGIRNTWNEPFVQRASFTEHGKVSISTDRAVFQTIEERAAVTPHQTLSEPILATRAEPIGSTSISLYSDVALKLTENPHTAEKVASAPLFNEQKTDTVMAVEAAPLTSGNDVKVKPFIDYHETPKPWQADSVSFYKERSGITPEVSNSSIIDFQYSSKKPTQEDIRSIGVVAQKLNTPDERSRFKDYPNNTREQKSFGNSESRNLSRVPAYKSEESRPTVDIQRGGRQNGIPASNQTKEALNMRTSSVRQTQAASQIVSQRRSEHHDSPRSLAQGRITRPHTTQSSTTMAASTPQTPHSIDTNSRPSTKMRTVQPSNESLLRINSLNKQKIEGSQTVASHKALDNATTSNVKMRRKKRPSASATGNTFIVQENISSWPTQTEENEEDLKHSPLLFRGRHPRKKILLKMRRENTRFHITTRKLTHTKQIVTEKTQSALETLTKFYNKWRNALWN